MEHDPERGNRDKHDNVILHLFIFHFVFVVVIVAERMVLYLLIYNQQSLECRAKYNTHLALEFMALLNIFLQNAICLQGTYPYIKLQ